MKDYRSLNHTKWDCKYHVVFIPKRRKKRIYGRIRKHLGRVFHELGRQKDSATVDGHLRPDHIHMCVSIPPKFAMSSVIVYIKGKSYFNCKKHNGAAEEFCGRKLLGSRILCVHGRFGRKSLAKVYFRAGEGKRPPRIT